jgi:hypothetical protein
MCPDSGRPCRMRRRPDEVRVMIHLIKEVRFPIPEVVEVNPASGGPDLGVCIQSHRLSDVAVLPYRIPYQFSRFLMEAKQILHSASACVRVAL